MCGIAGYIGGDVPDMGRVRTCLGRMGRRGPDASGIAHFTTSAGRQVVLLHSRLSIIDLDPRANQPFTRGTQSLVFNGEIYNYVELRGMVRERSAPPPDERLAGTLALPNSEDGARRGPTDSGERLAGMLDVAIAEWETESDTEVLLRVLAARGVAGLDACEGMWAFAWYDARTETTTLCRDRFGEKPLYVYRDATGLYFGSEVKFIAALLGRMPPINRHHLYRYLVNGYKSLYTTGETFYEGVREVPPGCAMAIDAEGREHLDRYWMPSIAPDEALRYEDCVAMARAALIESVRLRLRADVPLSFCMSGGIDSNALIAIAKRVLLYDVHGFTIVNTDVRYDEWDLVDHSAKSLGIHHTAVPVTTRDFLPRLRELVRYHDAPVFTITYYAQWLLMREIAAQGYRIAVSGTGADELFSGYYDHHLMYLRAVRGDDARHAGALRDWETHVKPLVRNPYLRDPELFVHNGGFRDHIFLQSDEFATCLRTPWSEPFAETAYCDELLRNRMMNELFHESVPVILHEDDLNAMYHSIENRSPFLDRRLFDTCARIPTRHLVRRGYAKAVLRDAVRGLAPDKVLDTHRKVGFNAPIHAFLDVNDRGVREYLLDVSPVYEHVRRDRIEALLHKGLLPNSESKFLFYFVNSKIFLEEAAA